MAMPKRTSPEDYYAHLPLVARPHLEALREICRRSLPDAQETLHWNTPVLVQDGSRLVMLQAFAAHASLRFPPRQFADQRAAVEAAGYEAGDGFVKLPYDRELPTALLEQLLAARLAEYEATGAGW